MRPLLARSALSALLLAPPLAAALAPALAADRAADREIPPNVAEADIELRLPPEDAFTFGPGDTLAIWVWRHEDLTVEVTVAPDGYISYPIVGRVQIAGMTYEEVVRTLQLAVNEYYVDAKVSVNVTKLESHKVLVIGEVMAPQILQITSELSLLEAVSRAGGINPDARTRNILVIRGGVDAPQLFTVDVDALIRHGDMTQMVYLRPGDIVYVPTQTITNVERFFRKLQAVLAPAVGGSSIYRNFATTNAQRAASQN